MLVGQGHRTSGQKKTSTPPSLPPSIPPTASGWEVRVVHVQHMRSQACGMIRKNSIPSPIARERPPLPPPSLFEDSVDRVRPPTSSLTLFRSYAGMSATRVGGSVLARAAALHV